MFLSIFRNNLDDFDNFDNDIQFDSNAKLFDEVRRVCPSSCSPTRSHSLSFQVCSKSLSIFDINEDSSKLWKNDGDQNDLPFTFDNQLKLQSTSANPDSPDDDDEDDDFHKADFSHVASQLLWSNAQQQQHQQQNVLSDNPWGSDTSSTLQQQQPQQTPNDINSWGAFPGDNFADFDSHFDSFDMPQDGMEDDTDKPATEVEGQFFDTTLEDSHDEIIT